jgi:alkylhydroperoxidase family enzyme
MEVEKLDLSNKERGLFALALKVHADPHSVTDEEITGLRKMGTTDQEIVEIIEVTNFGDSINRFCDTLGIGADAFLTYEMEEQGSGGPRD